jgi:hypothetical protein
VRLGNKRCAWYPIKKYQGVAATIIVVIGCIVVYGMCCIEVRVGIDVRGDAYCMLLPICVQFHCRFYLMMFCDVFVALHDAIPFFIEQHVTMCYHML